MLASPPSLAGYLGGQAPYSNVNMADIAAMLNSPDAFDRTATSITDPADPSTFEQLAQAGTTLFALSQLLGGDSGPAPGGAQDQPNMLGEILRMIRRDGPEAAGYQGSYDTTNPDLIPGGGGAMHGGYDSYDGLNPYATPDAGGSGWGGDFLAWLTRRS